MNEYIRLTHAEQIYGKRQLLHSEMHILESLKHIERYTKLRTREMSLKAELKRRTTKIKLLLKGMDKELPKVPHHHHESRPEMPEISKTRDDLEIEINTIKRKLAELNS